MNPWSLARRMATAIERAGLPEQVIGVDNGGVYQIGVFLDKPCEYRPRTPAEAVAIAIDVHHATINKGGYPCFVPRGHERCNICLSVVVDQLEAAGRA